MNELARYRRALETIAYHLSGADKDGYHDEWTEAAAFGEAKDIARRALEPE